MEIIHTETNRGKKAIIVDGYTYRKINILKSGDVVYICSVDKKCTKSITTDAEGVAIIRTKNQHVCEYNPSDRKSEAKQLRVRSRKNSGDVSKRPSTVVRNELKTLQESHLEPKDIKNASLALYRERRKLQPKLPKSREDIQSTIDQMDVKTNKDENFVKVNDKDTGIVIFSTDQNLDCIRDMEELFIDGTFKCCPKYFYQLYSIHGCKNGNYVPLLFALLPSKSEECYKQMWSFIQNCCLQKGFEIQPRVIHIDFERSMHNAIRVAFPTTLIDCCRFHLGQNWWRRIQKLGLSTEYKDKSCEIGKWLTRFFGLPFLTPDSIEDSFVEDIMGDAPNDNRCHQFADYILDGYVAETSSYPPLMWAAVPDERNKRTNNGPEAFHSHFNGQFYTSHPNIFVFLDVLKQIQTTTYVKMRSLNNEALVRRAETERLRYSIDKYNDFRTGSISRLNYISALGYKFSAVTDF